MRSSMSSPSPAAWLETTSAPLQAQSGQSSTPPGLIVELPERKYSSVGQVWEEPLGSIVLRVQTPSGRPGPPALGLETIVPLPRPEMTLDATTGGRPGGVRSTRYWPRVSATVARADSPLIW